MTDRTSTSKVAKVLKVALLCGGPSLERGISLNSARSVMDHLQSENITIKPVYFNQKKEAFLLSPAQLYSNTPSDFDFKLDKAGQALSDRQLESELKSVDIVFPVIHGAFGEDGTIQKWLEDRNIPFAGSSSAACKLGFDKFRANEFIKQNGFFAMPSCLLKIYSNDENKQIAADFFKEHKIKRAIVKPAAGGSSIGVFSVSNADEAIDKANLIFGKRMDTRVVIEPFVEGREFTVIVLQSRFGLPVAILPTEIETDYTQHQVFDFRRKYLPTRQVTYHCPPRFDDRLIERIQLQSEQLFVLLGMSDFARFDGWILDDGSIWFADFNPISGMEQNSFLFQQAARIGLSHRSVLEHIVIRACDRQNINHPLSYESIEASSPIGKEPLAILMGGMTSERQVSLMSGTNVWLKLRNSSKFQPIPYLMDMDGGIWKVPYQLLLNHTVEEIIENCRSAALHERRINRFETYARERLGYYDLPNLEDFGKPERLTLEQLIEKHNRVFIAMHGGMGEDGRLQEMLEQRNGIFNGPGSVASQLCMDKQLTADAVDNLHLPNVQSIPGKSFELAELEARIANNTDLLWRELLQVTEGRTLIAKPIADGCSSGVVHLYDGNDLARYISLLTKRAGSIPPNTFRNQTEPIELPLEPPDAIRFEKHIRTDIVRVKGGALKHTPKTDLVEVTVGVVEQGEKMHAFNPSITIADGEVLSVEEKFQGGTGVNLTPPPEEIMPQSVRRKVQRSMEAIATRLDIRGYSRIDAFVNCKTSDIYIIEVNTLPGLTPSTVIFQQALAENPSMYPREFLELIADNRKIVAAVAG
jgi:D-alanine--D-alanine ligase